MSEKEVRQLKRADFAEPCHSGYKYEASVNDEEWDIVLIDRWEVRAQFRKIPERRIYTSIYNMKFWTPKDGRKPSKSVPKGARKKAKSAGTRRKTKPD